MDVDKELTEHIVLVCMCVRLDDWVLGIGCVFFSIYKQIKCQKSKEGL